MNNEIHGSIKVVISLFMLGLLIAMPWGITAGADDIRPADAPPTRAWLDIAIEGIERIQSTVSSNVYPGQTVEVAVRLVHDVRPYASDTPITNSNPFTVVVVIDDGKGNVSTMYKQVTSMPLTYTAVDPNTGLINPLFVSFFWTAPTRPPQGSTWAQMSYSVYATITVDDDDKSDNFRSGSAIRISEPDFQPRIHQEGETKPGVTSKVHDVSMGEAVFLPFELWNEGPAVDIIGMEYLSIPEGWVPSPFEPIEVFPNNFQEMSLALLVSPNPVLAQHDLTYDLVVRPYSTFFKEGPYNIDPTYTFKFKVRLAPACIIDPVSSSMMIVPDVKTDVHFTLRNTGNTRDTYTLSWALDERASKEWRVDFKSGIGQPTVSPGESTVITVGVTVPINTAKNQNVQLFIKAESSRRQGMITTSSACVIFAAERYAAVIEPQTEPHLVEPGRENRISFNFTNMGNDKDPNQALRVQSAPKGWKVFIDQSPLKTGNGLGPRTRTRVTMTVFLPETSTTSYKAARPPFVVIQAVGGPYLNILDSEQFFFEVPLKNRVGLSTNEPVKTGFVGGQTEFTVFVQNKGNWDDTFNLTTDFKWANLEMDRTPPLFANDTVPVRVVVRIPSDAAADTNPDTPRILDGYRIRIFAYSQNETRKGATLVSLDLTLKVAPFYSFDMALAPGENPLRFSTDHDQVRVVKVRIRNTGNIADLIRLEWEDNPFSSWIFLQNVYVDVPYKEYFDAMITIRPKSFTVAEAQIISMNLIGYSQYDTERIPFRSNITLNLEFFTLMFEVNQPRMNNQTIQAAGTRVELDRKYSFQLEISNVGTEDLNPIYMDRLFIVLYDAGFEVDRSNITYLVKGGERTVYFVWYASTPGQHILTFALEGSIPISNRGVNEKQMSLIVNYTGSPPIDGDDTPQLVNFMPQIILMIIFGLAIFVFLYMFNKIFISAIDTGYDEDGTYRPWAVREKLREEEQLQSAPERPALPSPAPAAAPRQLNPAPAAPAQVQPFQARPMPAQPMPSRPQAAPVAAAQPRSVLQPTPVQPVPVQRPPQ